MIDQPTESRRVADAAERAARRVSGQRDTLRPLGLAVILVVVAGAAGGQPQPGLHGKGLGVTLALLTFAGAMAVAIRDRFTNWGDTFQAGVITVMGAAGVALVALHSQGTTELAGGAAVWMAVTRLPLVRAVALAVAIGAALDAAAVASGSSSVAVLAGTLILALLALVAYFIKQARAGQDRTELLLAQLEDARDDQTRAAAIAERNRIAGELHDVLAHSLSGAAIQLQAARKLAEREHASPPLHTAIERAGQLVSGGLTSARQAVGALRGDELPGVAQLDGLIAGFRNDMALNVALSVDGTVRALPADASLALFRGAQEALTNVVRYAPGATAEVRLRYAPERTTLSIEDRLPAATVATGDGLCGVGGGRGLVGLRERVERLGGSVNAGPTENGWRVDVVMPL